MSDEMTKARSEAVQEVASAMLKAAGEALERHGNDPMSEVILGAAIAMFVDRAQGIALPGFKRRLIAILQSDAR